MRVKVDTELCSGHARCVAKAPNVYRLNSDGYNETPEAEVPAGLEDEARRGARACPERAITIIED
jgi:ferredoxin